jgi:hypothetical protein
MSITFDKAVKACRWQMIKLTCPGHWQWSKKVTKMYCFITCFFGTEIHGKMNSRAFVSGLTESQVFSTWVGSWPYDHYTGQGLQAMNDWAYMLRALVIKEKSYKNVLFCNVYLLRWNSQKKSICSWPTRMSGSLHLGKVLTLWALHLTRL